MKERLLDVIKWGLILIIAGTVFYVVYPRYYFNNYKGLWTRGNKMTGKIEACSGFRGLWLELGIHPDERAAKMGIIWDKSTPIEPNSKDRFVLEGLEKAKPKP